jgi:oligopeptide/dipeptide ABC transporter ATP-binding protein
VSAGLFRGSRTLHAVNGVTLALRRGEVLGLVGESGCGKTTVGRSILRLIEPTAGKVLFEGTDVASLDRGELRRMRPRMQIVFQDPYSSLNPRRVILEQVGEGLSEHGRVKNLKEKTEQVVALLEKVGLNSQILYRYPHEFSGGQRQRIAIARAIALEPSLVVCDEAVSALDVSIQAQIINLLIDLRREFKMAYLFIAHDLAVVKHISQRIAVMYLGQIVESAPTNEIFHNPLHPYTQALLSAIPVPDPHHQKKRTVLRGEIGNTSDFSTQCCFASRCPLVQEICRRQEPPLINAGAGHIVKCILVKPEN